MGLNPIRGGRVDLLGQDLLSLRGEALRTARRALQMVFQDPLACLNPALQVACLLYTSPSPRDKRQSRMPSSA